MRNIRQKLRGKSFSRHDDTTLYLGERYDPLLLIPYDVMVLIISFLDAREILSSVARVNSSWKQLAMEERIWKNLCLSKWNSKKIVLSNYHNSWREVWRKNNNSWDWCRDSRLERCVRFNDSNLTISSLGSQGYTTIRGTTEFRKGDGVFEWKIKILKKTDESFMKLGVCTPELIDRNVHQSIGLSEFGYGYGYGYRWHVDSTHHESMNVPYGRHLQIGDIIGFHLDMNEMKLRFSHNGEDLGIAYSKMPEILIPAVTLNASVDAVSLFYD